MIVDPNNADHLIVDPNHDRAVCERYKRTSMTAHVLAKPWGGVGPWAARFSADSPVAHALDFLGKNRADHQYCR